LVHGVLELLPLLRREVFDVDIHDIHDVRHLDFRLWSHFMRGLCHHYGVELHNFAPNAISQAATFVRICEGSWGSP
jgi:hypothetical protein